MPLDPIAKMLLDQMAAAGRPPLNELPLPEARASIEAMVDLGGPEEAVAALVDRTVPGAAGAIPIRVYTPAGAGPFPALVYFHGGGWVIGSIASIDRACRALTNAAGCVVISVEYRLAPEHKYPAAAEDCLAVTEYVMAHPEEFGAVPGRVAVGGDSAGGNLAAVVCQMMRDHGDPMPNFQLLIYPVTDHSYTTDSYRDNADGYLLTRASMEWFWNHYLSSPADGTQPYASPLRAEDLSGLPPALVITAEFDPLRDEGEAYAVRLKDAGVPVTLTRYDGMTHAFWQLAGVLPQGRQAIAQAADALRRAGA